jgi:PTS system nitrogen regulatory IIA component
VDLARTLKPENIAVGLAAKSAHEVQRALVDLLDVPGSRLRKTILESVVAREKIQTTGIGHGIAIPHGTAEIDRDLLAAVAITRSPVDYESMDGEPVRIFILLVSRPEATGAHLKGLAHVARLLGQATFREALLASETPEAVLALIRGEESPVAADG